MWNSRLDLPINNKVRGEAWHMKWEKRRNRGEGSGY
jgi:hypothetical protein